MQKCTLFIVIFKIVPAILLACAETVRHECMCFIQLFEVDTSSDGGIILNQYGCPTMALTKVIVPIKSQQVLSPASVCHNCDQSCMFSRKPTKRKIEQEDVELNALQLVHCRDLNSFLFNIYCMKCPSLNL